MLLVVVRLSKAEQPTLGDAMLGCAHMCCDFVRDQAALRAKSLAVHGDPLLDLSRRVAAT